MGISNRQKEIKRRRHRRQKLVHLRKRLNNATASEKEHIVRKLREMTPGADVIISNWELNEADR